MMAHRLLVPALASLAVMSTVGCTDDGIIASASLRVTNHSDFAIVEIYLAEVGDPVWGSNLLGDDVLLPGEALLLGVTCGFYDALLIDEDHVDCELDDLDLCRNDADWVIHNNTCSVFGARKAASPRQAAPQGSAVRP